MVHARASTQLLDARSEISLVLCIEFEDPQHRRIEFLDRSFYLRTKNQIGGVPVASSKRRGGLRERRAQCRKRFVHASRSACSPEYFGKST
jgi:hypothetical protein